MLARAVLSAARFSSATWNDWPSGFWGGGQKVAGVTVTEESALQLSTAFACTRVISATGAGLPLKLYLKRADGGRDVVTDHPASRIVQSTYDEYDEQGTMLLRLSGFRRQVNKGNFYAQIGIDSYTGEINGLHPIHPDRVEEEIDDNGRLVYKVQTTMGMEYLRPWQMLHVPSINPDASGLRGVGVIAQAAQSLGIGLAQEINEGAQWQHGSRPQLVVKTKRKWDPKARSRFRKDWEEIHQGPDRSGKIGLLEDGAELEILSYSNQDAQFLLLKQHRVEDICRWYGVQPHLVAHLLRSTNNNIEQQSVEFVQYTMLPWLVAWESFMNIRLLTREERKRGLYFKHSVDGLLRGDAYTRTKALQIQAMYGALNADEWRAIEERNPLPHGVGQQFWRPTNVAVIGDFSNGLDTSSELGS